MTDVAHRQLGEFLLMASDALALPFEANFQPAPFIAFARNNWPLAFGLVIAYMVVIFGIQHFMAERKPFVLRLELAVWNAFLCIFSFIGMCKTLPYLFGLILTRTFEETVCENPMQSWGVGSTGLWVMLFIFSKIPELIDTIFIVLRKKPLIFLHYYHHVTVLLFCWSSYSSIAGSGLFFVSMNYCVHALMYGYYCLQALNVCPKSFPAYLITFMQIGQMFIGTGVCISSWYYLLAGRTCSNDLSNLVAGGLMYGSYLYLFCEFAVRRYSNKGKKVGVKKLE